MKERGPCRRACHACSRMHTLIVSHSFHILSLARTRAHTECSPPACIIPSHTHTRTRAHADAFTEELWADSPHMYIYATSTCICKQNCQETSLAQQADSDTQIKGMQPPLDPTVHCFTAPTFDRQAPPRLISPASNALLVQSRSDVSRLLPLDDEADGGNALPGSAVVWADHAHIRLGFEVGYELLLQRCL